MSLRSISHLRTGATALTKEPPILNANRSAVVLVDYQQRLMPAIDDGGSALEEAIFLARVARLLGIPVIGTEQNPDKLGPNAETIRSLCDRTMSKMHFGAATEGLADLIWSFSRDIDQVVVGGCEAHVCLLQTAIGLQQAGFRVFVVPGACGSRRTADKQLAMQRLVQGGSILTATEMAAFEWMHSALHPRFREVQALIKERPVSLPQANTI
jgi:nicotinamidase-related amidase